MSEYKSEYAMLERQKKGSPPEEGEVGDTESPRRRHFQVPSGGDPRRARGGSIVGKRPGYPGPGMPPPKRGMDPRARP